MAVYLTVDLALLAFLAVLLAGPAPALALPLPLLNKTVEERAWEWWSEPPYLSWTEEEGLPPLLEGVHRGIFDPSPMPANAPEEWTERTADEYMREERTEELQCNAAEALERIGYWSALEHGIIRTVDAPTPSPSPTFYVDLNDDQDYTWQLETRARVSYDSDNDPPDINPGWGERPQVSALGPPPYDDYNLWQEAQQLYEWD